MQELRQCAKQNKIELIPCKHFFEMIKNLSYLKNIVVIDGNKYLQFIDYLKGFNCEAFLVKDCKIESLDGKTKFVSYNEFFESEVFDFVNENFEKIDEEYVNLKLEKVNVFMNNWKSIFLKNLIIQMKQKNCQHVTKDFIKIVCINYGVKDKNLNIALAPILKEFAKLTHLNYEKFSTYKVIDDLYRFVFNE